MRYIARAAVLFCVISMIAPWAHANFIYLNIPSIPGNDPTPGFPGAMAVQSLSIISNGFSVVRKTDSVTPQIVSAATLGTQLSTVKSLLYNAAPSGPPDATIPFKQVLASSVVSLGGVPTMERDTYNSTSPVLLYLEIPGITGESSTPGHAGIMPVQSFSTTGNNFTIQKSVDKASPKLQLDVANGTPIPTATLLSYDTLTPSSDPDLVTVFHNVLASSYQVSGGIIPQEQVAFNFITVTQPVPEPAAAAIVVACLGWIGLARGQRFAK